MKNFPNFQNVSLQKRLLIGFALLALLLAGYMYTQTVPLETHASPEAISDFHAEIRVNADNSIDVTETIVYNTAPDVQKHGIFRSIRLISTSGNKIDVTNLHFTNEKGYSIPATFVGNTENAAYSLGDPNSTFTGERTYVISYHVKDAVSHLRNIDEIYWNVTGNGWAFPIAHASANVTLPNGSMGTQSACYVGPVGSTERCANHYTNTEATPQFETEATLEPGSGLTIAVGFPLEPISVGPP